MARSSRKRKQARAKREAAARKRTAQRARNIADDLVREVIERYDRLADPATPAAEAAALIAEHYQGTPVSSLIADTLLGKGSSPERLNQIAEALLAHGTRYAAGAQDQEGAAETESAAESGGTGSGAAPSLTALTFAAGAARAAGDRAAARRLLDQALAVAADSGDPHTRSELARHLSASGRHAEAVELLEARLREEPGDIAAGECYGSMIELLYERVSVGAPDECGCGLSRAWADCCGPRERAAIDRFADRKGLNEFLAAVHAYAAESGFGTAIQDQVTEWLASTDELEWDPAERDQLAGLAEETALLGAGDASEDDGESGGGTAVTADVTGEGATETGDDAEHDERSVMTAFAADPSVPAELAARAVAWAGHIHYGLWQVAEPGPAPGLWCTDISSSVTRYAEFPAEVTDGTPRWAVWLGALVPVDGIWRCTGRGLWLSPDEADAAAELVQDAFTAIVAELTGQRGKKRSRPRTGPLRFGRAEPYGVFADHDEPAPDYAVTLLSKVTAALLQRVVGEVHAHRTTPPGLLNSDGDQMCLITARIAVSDGEQTADRLARRTDFEREPGDPGRVVWLGLPVPDAQRATMLAEVTAQFRAQGLPGPALDEPERPQRWIRGTLKVRGNEIVAEVNSAERLARLLDILARAGTSPVVTGETRVDPAEDIGWPGGPRALPGGTAPAGEGWEKHWLDEKVPALRGRTPRQAAHGKERPRLEALLRQAEYEASLLAAQGKPGIDTVWLRHELAMDDDQEDARR